MNRRASHVSDHAVLRYLEWVHGLDIEAHRAEIAATVARGAALGAIGVVSNGFRYILVDGHVTTVMPATQPDVRTGRVQRRKQFDE